MPTKSPTITKKIPNDMYGLEELVLAAVLKGFHVFAFVDTFAAAFFGVNQPLFSGSKLFINFEFLLAFI